MRKRVALLPVLLICALVMAPAAIPPAAPAAVAWTDTGGPFASDPVIALAYDGNRNILYAGTDSNGAYRCTNPDSSPSWTGINGAMTLTGIESLAYDSANNTLYAGGQGPGGADHVWRLKDPDTSTAWFNITDSSWDSNYAVTSLAFNPTDGILFASTQYRQVRRLTSPGKPFPFGATWELVGGPSTWTNKVAMGSGDARLYIGMPGAGARRCENPNGTIPPPPIIVDMGGEPSDDSHTMLHFAYQADGDNLFATTRKGTEYYAFRCGEPDGSIPRAWTDMGWPQSRKIGYSALSYSPEDDTLFVAGQGVVYRCREPGTSSSWTDMTGNLSGEWVESIAYDEDWRYLYVGTSNGGVWRAPVDFKPRLDSIDPGSGPVGTTVTIEGDFFGSSRGDSYVTFGYEQAADYVSWTDERIEAKVPADASGSAEVKVTTAGGTSDAAGFAVEPVITEVTPSSAYAGTTIAISGTGFGTSRGSSSVAFGSQNASGYGSWSNTEVEAVVPEAGLGTVDLTVKTRGGTSNAVDFEVTGATYYFAEGYTASGFQEYLCIGNAGEKDATVDVTYIFNDGADPLTETYAVPAASRYTVDVNSAAGAGREVSLKVESSSPEVVAERPMYFNYQGPNARGWSGGHDAVGAPRPDREWYFAEGTTRTGFEQWITVLNPGDDEATLTFRYMVEGEGEAVRTEKVDASSRATFSAASHVGLEKDISLLVESDSDVVVERPVYFDYRGLTGRSWKGGHCVVGANSPAETWYFAEGTTREGFEEWLCLQNPGDSDIEVKATYMLGPGQGDPVTRSYQVPAKQRLTVSVNLEIGAGKDVSARLTSGSEFIAERPMYFNYQGPNARGWDGGHDVLGAVEPAKSWFMAEGYTGTGFEEWLCIQNPCLGAADVTVTYYPKSGVPIERTHVVGGSQRLTINVNTDAGAGLEISTMVVSDQPVIVERPIYFAFGGAWTGGHDVVGFPGR